MMRSAQSMGLAVLCLSLCSCTKDESIDLVNSNKETFPVSGQVHVDGRPANKVFATCHNVKELDQENVHRTLALTDETGKLEFSTYQSGDGVPEGEYVLTFEWG